jgi:Domain of unknown function (DUF4349)
MAGRRSLPILAIIVAVATVALSACSGEERAVDSAVPAARAPGGDGAGSGGSAPAEDGAGAEVLDLQLPVVGPRVIKTASLAVEVREGSFGDRFQQATLIAARHGGFVSSSRTEGDERRLGTVVLRVPAESFEAAVGELKALGSVKAEELSGEDVTAQFVDLEARLRNWEAQEEVLLGLMERATTIQESITVQRTLQEVQLAIEEIRGRLRVLEDQTAMSTITVSMSEPGVAPAKPGDGIPSLSEAWNLALDGFVTVISTVVITLGYVVPIGLIVLAGWLGFRRVRPRTREATTA